MSFSPISCTFFCLFVLTRSCPEKDHLAINYIENDNKTRWKLLRTAQPTNWLGEAQLTLSLSWLGLSLQPLKIDVDYGWSSKLSSVRCQTENSFHVMSLQSMIQNWNKISKHFLIPARQQQQLHTYNTVMSEESHCILHIGAKQILKTHWNILILKISRGLFGKCYSNQNWKISTLENS